MQHCIKKNIQTKASMSLKVYIYLLLHTHAMLQQTQLRCASSKIANNTYLLYDSPVSHFQLDGCD